MEKKYQSINQITQSITQEVQTILKQQQDFLRFKSLIKSDPEFNTLIKNYLSEKQESFFSFQDLDIESQ